MPGPRHPLRRLRPFVQWVPVMDGDDHPIAQLWRTPHRWLIVVAGLSMVTTVILSAVVRGWGGLLQTVGALVGIALVELAVYRPAALTQQIAAIGPIVLFLAVGWATPDRTDSLGFYSAMAEVIPVLFLALLLDARGLASTRPSHRRTNLMIALYLFAAGIETMRPLLSGDAKDGRASVVLAAIAAAVLGLVLNALAARSESGLPTLSSPQ